MFYTVIYRTDMRRTPYLFHHSLRLAHRNDAKTLFLRPLSYILVYNFITRPSLKNDSVFAKRVLTYWEYRGNPGYSHMNVLIVPLENYTFFER